MTYYFLIQFLNTLNNPVIGIGQIDMVFVSRFVTNRIRIANFAIPMVVLGGFIVDRIRIADFALAMVFLGGFIIDRIGIADFANNGGSGGDVKLGQ